MKTKIKRKHVCIAIFTVLFAAIVFWRCSAFETEASAHWAVRYPSPNGKLEFVISCHGGTGAIGGNEDYVISLCRKGDLIDDAIDQYFSRIPLDVCKWNSDNSATIDIASFPMIFPLPSKIGGIETEWVKTVR